LFLLQAWLHSLSHTYFHRWALAHLLALANNFFHRKGPTAQLGLIGGRPNAAEAARLGAGPEMTEFSLIDNIRGRVPGPNSGRGNPELLAQGGPELLVQTGWGQG